MHGARGTWSRNPDEEAKYTRYERGGEGARGETKLSRNQRSGRAISNRERDPRCSLGSGGRSSRVFLRRADRPLSLPLLQHVRGQTERVIPTDTDL